MAVLESIERWQFLGGEFLIWLWRQSELADGKIEVPGVDDLELRIGGNLVFEGESEDARKIQLQGENTGRAAEAKAALYENKLVRKAVFLFRLDGADWKATLDANNFTISSMSIPAPTSGMHFNDSSAIRLELLERFTDAFEKLYQRFLELRLNDAAWDKQIADIKQWISGK